MIALVLAIVLLQTAAHGQMFSAAPVGGTANFTFYGQTSSMVCTRNGQQIILTGGKYALVSNNNTGTTNFTIYNVIQSDYGRYECLPTGNLNSLIIFSLIVVDTMTMGLMQLTNNLNDNVTITCKVTFYMENNTILSSDQDLILSLTINYRELARDNTTTYVVTSTRTRSVNYSGSTTEEMKQYNVTCQLKSPFYYQSAWTKVLINYMPQKVMIDKKLANSNPVFSPGDSIICSVDSYPLVPVIWARTRVDPTTCATPPIPYQGNGQSTLTLTDSCTGSQTWNCSASSLGISVNDDYTFTVTGNGSQIGGVSAANADEEKRRRDIGLGVGLGLGIPLLLLLIGLILVFCCGVGRGGTNNIKQAKNTQPAKKTPPATTTTTKQATPTTTNPNPNPNFLPSYTQASKSGNGSAPGVPDIGFAHLNGSGSIPQLNSSLDGQVNFRSNGGQINLGKADLGVQNRSFTNI